MNGRGTQSRMNFDPVLLDDLAKVFAKAALRELEKQTLTDLGEACKDAQSAERSWNYAKFGTPARPKYDRV